MIKTDDRTDIRAYLDAAPRIVSAAAVEAMTNAEFEEVLESSETAPVKLTGTDPETGEEISAYCIPIGVFDGMIGMIRSTYHDMDARPQPVDEEDFK